jgi:hypothetical protein
MFFWTDKTFQTWLQSIQNTMATYEVHNKPFHTSNNVNDHCIWTMFAVTTWWDSNSVWTRSLPVEWKHTALFAAFMHDIGKTGDGDFTTLVVTGVKPDHPAIGWSYMIGQRQYMLNTNDDVINLWDEAILHHVPISVMAAAALAAAMHYEFYLVIVRRRCVLAHDIDASCNAYIRLFMQHLTVITTKLSASYSGSVVHFVHNREWIGNCIRLCLLVSHADIRGSNPVERPLTSMNEMTAFSDSDSSQKHVMHGETNYVARRCHLQSSYIAPVMRAYARYCAASSKFARECQHCCKYIVCHEFAAN